jgi:hypothetical protein
MTGIELPAVRHSAWIILALYIGLSVSAHWGDDRDSVGVPGGVATVYEPTGCGQ